VNPAFDPHPIQAVTGLPIYRDSVALIDGAALFLARTGSGPRLGILAARESPLRSRFDGEVTESGEQLLSLCRLTHANAVALREELPWLQPRPLGLRTSAGCGDRLGLATPGHVRAARQVQERSGEPVLGMIFAQQSIREMTRTARTPEQVLDDATWGTFQEGWRASVGADADHLKTLTDLERCAAVGYSFFTIDPGEHVDSGADKAGSQALLAAFEALPWPQLETTPADLRARYANLRFDLGDRALALDQETLARAGVKYGRAVAHTVRMYRRLVEVRGARAFELEASVDETATPTSPAEHAFIASELKRLGVRWVSLAPRFVGRFEKGVDYIGDLHAFERDLAAHAAIARAMGPYKLSLHSGSDKFSIYPIAAQHAQGLLHLKTAGTSYLEALRALASFDPALFREILAFAIERYETDRASYHVSASLQKVPAADAPANAELPNLLEQFDARQVLHVTFGSVLTSERGFKARLLAGLAAHEEAHYAALQRHFVRHLQPLTRV